MPAGRYAESEVLLRGILGGTQQMQQVDSSSRIFDPLEAGECELALAACLQKQGKESEAEPYIRYVFFWNPTHLVVPSLFCSGTLQLDLILYPAPYSKH